MDKELKEKLNRKIIKEICKFRAEIIKMDKENIYDAHEIINFYEKIYEYMTCSYAMIDEYDIKNCIEIDNFIEKLYNYCMDMDMLNHSTVDYDTISEIIDGFIEYSLELKD